MKTYHVILALCVIALVFAISFAMNYREARKNTDAPTPVSQVASLRFDSSRFPVTEGVNQEWELKEPGHADFWFENANDVGVQVGVQQKTCTCATVEVYLANADWQARRKRTGDVEKAGVVAGLVAHADARREVREQGSAETYLKHFELVGKDKIDGVEVPAQAIGWVRLKWTGDKKGSNGFRVQLWQNHRDSDIVQDLQVLLAFRSPYQVEKGFENLGAISAWSLPRELSITLFSQTRASLGLKAELDRPKGLDKAHDPVEVGAPLALSRDECDKLQDKYKDGPIACGYRIPVKLLAQAGGRPIDIGALRRVVRLTSDDPNLDPVDFPIVGEIQGDVQVGTPEDNGRIFFGTIDNNRVSEEKAIILSSDQPDIRLELDRSRVPEYLEVRLVGPKLKGALRAWRLFVKVKPNSVRGVFPRDDNPAYRDGAVYVKIVGPTGRLLRIPVEGNAPIK